ncbi:MAG: SDR family oxidoreductase [Trueperaceae bacterium]|nr:MAG: SDR family oxidoreductase [Trueperaceae bacterium]
MKRTVLITGASTGIGQACALHLQQNGFQVFAGVRKERDALALREQAPEDIVPIHLDVTVQDDITAAFHRVEEATGGRGLDGLVNNAGIAIGGALEFLPVEELRRQFDVNVIGPVAVVQTFLPLIRKATGRVVLMGAGISGVISPGGLGPYSASKFALEALSDSLRRELAPWGIHVALIRPGRIKTPIWDKSFEAAEQQLAGYPTAGLDLYASRSEPLFKTLARAKTEGGSVDDVARVVGHALTAEHPRSRYTVGLDARVASLVARILPDSILDALLRRFLS